MNWVRYDPARVGSETIHSGSTGAWAKRSLTTKATRRAPPTASQATVERAPHECRSAWSKPKTRLNIPMQPRASPKTSSARALERSPARGVGRLRRPKRKATTAMNMLMYSAQRQSSRSVSAPPRMRPVAAPTPPVAPSVANARPLSLRSVKVALSSASSVGARSAPKAPCDARAEARTAKEGAIPATRLETAKPVRPMWYARRMPRIAVSRPPKSTRPPKARV